MTHRARTPEERQAIYRFRYSVYVDELKRELGGVDHAAREVHDAEDEAPYTTHLYAGGAGQVSGALRIRSWGPGQVPPAIFAAHSLERIPGVERLSVCELGRFMIRPTLRGQALVPSLGAAGWELLAGEQRMDLVVLTCRPGLVDYYRRLGARTYGATMLPGPEGLEVPLLVVLSDQAWLKKIKSPLAGFANKYFGPGKRAPLDPAPFALARRG